MERIQTIKRPVTGQRKHRRLHEFGRIATLIADKVKAALLEELATYPKPGLVSYVDNGSHHDMNAEIFEKSARALHPFFAKLAAAGYNEAPLSTLRAIGIEAEKSMFSATNGVNTHKGAIFVLGLLAAAMGNALRNMTSLDEVGSIVARKWGNDLLSPAEFVEVSNGTNAFKHYGILGARGEAASGFENIFKVGLPVFKHTLKSQPRNVAAIQCFFALLENVDDTTLVHRGGMEGLKYAKKQAIRFNHSGGVYHPNWRNHSIGIHRDFINRRLSPGGVADLLSATFFMHDAITELSVTTTAPRMNKSSKVSK